ncbi:MAG TPA: M2 family metallopeptidase [Chlamydiales bacterium]|nr:M2 family metallopeptidase [Chlamydiales bacterium]
MSTFAEFLKSFVPTVEEKSCQSNKALWILETTGLPDAADLKASLDVELKMLFNDKKTYKKLLGWEKEKLSKEQKRQWNVLVRAFKQNMLPEELIKEITKKETELSLLYATFRPQFEGEKIGENAIREILSKEKDPKRRQKAWEASKEIGDVLGPRIRELVKLRNKGAKELGYKNYFEMQLDLQEVKEEWLMNFLDKLFDSSKKAYNKVIDEVEKKQMNLFSVSKKDLGPWAWSDPFGQEDPLDTHELDNLVKEVDIEAVAKKSFQKMGFDVEGILKRSDMYEKPGKNQHAFCIHMDRKGDVRTLNNIKPSMRWLETVLHELGHAVYELGYDQKLPWLLREPPHMIPTEAMALLSGRQAYYTSFLEKVLTDAKKKTALMKKAEESLRRRQLIFSRWVLVMTYFEQKLYQNPDADLNEIWWSLVEKYQGIPRPKNRAKKNDWAAKYHIGLAPVYYYSYLLGEVLASSIQEKIPGLFTQEAGEFLGEKLFSPGNLYPWDELAKKMLGKPLDPAPWVKEFA